MGRKQRKKTQQQTPAEYLTVYESRRLKLRQHINDQVVSWARTNITRYCGVCEKSSNSNKNTHHHWMCDECLNSWFMTRMSSGKSLGCAECDWVPSHDYIMRVLYPQNINAYILWSERMKKPLGIPHAGRCPHCGEVSEKNGGCNAMVCICGHTYCYACGETIFGLGHRCRQVSPLPLPVPLQWHQIFPWEFILSVIAGFIAALIVHYCISINATPRSALP